MEGLLVEAGLDLRLPHCRPSGFPTFAHQEISALQLELLRFAFGEVHLRDVDKLKAIPLDIGIPEVLPGFAPCLALGG